MYPINLLFTKKLLCSPLFWGSPSYCNAPRAATRSGCSSSLGEWLGILPGMLKYLCGNQSSGWEKQLLPQKKNPPSSEADPSLGPFSRLLRKIAHFLNVTSNYLLDAASVNSRSACSRSTRHINKLCMRTQLHFLLIKQNTQCSVQLALCQLHEDRYLMYYGTKLILQRFYRNCNW